MSVAVATPPELDRAAVPRDVDPTLNATEPVGEVDPLDAFTVAVSVVEALTTRIEGLADSDTVVFTDPELLLPPVQALKSAVMSADPTPVTMS